MNLYNQNVEKKNILEKIEQSIRQYFVFPEQKLKNFEINIDEIIKKAANGQLKEYTIDCRPLRNKYFFGERYTYGSRENGLGSERLYPKDTVDRIPNWITNSLINPLIEAKILPKNYVNSVVINDYQPGGCIVSHIDPPQIFDRPIISLSLFSDSALCFGCKFQYKPLRCSTPLLRLDMPRGAVTSLSGFAANEITHCVRPEDVTQRRAVIMLRRVHNCAPRLPTENQISNSHKIFKKIGSVVLNPEEFSKLHLNLLKWQNEGNSFGRIGKRNKNKRNFTRYTANYYKMV
ncbi:unnamed protein product [Psylliodes chrysocephalus]|uniref:Alpha-ketoglutarate-dependent dioxygenase alkB homolog 5 n=1 Tax=Psylliodes chrysocephalus TaxID=3402493 RepID=A0A9P0CSZ9_9CUCU|nr:unnamed protein product [Psylliodes chrysocephala]